MGKVDYDEVAPTYDQRYAGGGPTELIDFVRGLRSERGGGAVLEAGCGTGRWLKEVLHATTRVVGLDVSTLMLERARTQVPAAGIVRGRAEELPFHGASFKGVMCINAVHHFDRPQQFMREAWRVLEPGAILVVVALAPHDGLDRWYLYDYFGGTRETDCRRYPQTKKLADWMSEAGFDRVQIRVAARIRGTMFGEAVFGDPVLSKHGTSQLALLTDEEYEQGIRGIRAALNSARGDADPSFEVDLRLFGTSGRRPQV